MKYIVHISAQGYVDVEVEAANFEEAKKKACNETCNIDFGPLRDIEWYAACAEDENGKFVDY